MEQLKYIAEHVLQPMPDFGQAHAVTAQLQSIRIVVGFVILWKLYKWKNGTMSISQKAIFCYIKPKVLSKEDTLQPTLPRKRFSEASNIFKEKLRRQEEIQDWGQPQERVVRYCETEKFMDKNYNEGGQLFIIINKVDKVKQDDQSTTSIRCDKSPSARPQ